MEFSVIICSYNPKMAYLSRVLDALKKQTLDYKNWELLIIDNNSDKPISERIDISWHPNSKILLESKQGVTPARILGIQMAKAQFIVFVDDDNVLSVNYLKKALHIINKNPDIGAFGGSQKPEFEVNPAPNLLRYTGKLALRDVLKNQIIDYYDGSIQPYGAGLVIRKNIAQNYIKKASGTERELLGRVGNSLSSSEDTDMVYTSIDMGYKNGLFPDLELTHLIPKERVTLDYLQRLRMGMNYSGMLLSYYRFNEKPKSLKFYFLRKLNYLRKKITMNNVEYSMYMASEKARIKFFNTIEK